MQAGFFRNMNNFAGRFQPELRKLKPNSEIMTNVDTSPVIVTQHFTASVEIVWRAITQREQMTQWFFENIPAFEAVEGFETRFIIENEGRVFPHHWQIKTVVPQQKIVLGWRYEGYEGDSDVIFELKEEDEETVLTVTHQVTQPFPSGIPEFTRESCEGGWRYFIHERLTDYLSNQ